MEMLPFEKKSFTRSKRSTLRPSRLIPEEQEDLRAAFELFSVNNRITPQRLPYFLRAMGIDPAKDVIDSIIARVKKLKKRSVIVRDDVESISLDQISNILEDILPSPASEEYVMTLLNTLDKEHFNGWMYINDLKEIFNKETKYPPKEKLKKKEWKELCAVADPKKTNKFVINYLAAKIGS